MKYSSSGPEWSAAIFTDLNIKQGTQATSTHAHSSSTIGVMTRLERSTYSPKDYNADNMPLLTTVTNANTEARRFSPRRLALLHYKIGDENLLLSVIFQTTQLVSTFHCLISQCSPLSILDTFTRECETAPSNATV